MDFAREFGLRPDIIEKDYVLGRVVEGHPCYGKIGYVVKIKY